jgi:hypothetical protein
MWERITESKLGTAAFGVVTHHPLQLQIPSLAMGDGHWEVDFAQNDATGRR